MVTRILISALDRAQSPRAVKAATWMLEQRTGIRTSTLIEAKDYSSDEWYRREGFYRIGGMSGSQSYAGKNVSVDTALDSTAVYACVKIIAEDVGAAPLHLMEQNKTGETKEAAFANSLYRVLNGIPNPNMSSREFREALTSRSCLGLDGFATIKRSKETSQVIALYPLTNATVRADFNDQGQLFYVVKYSNSQEKTFRREEIFHLKGYTLDGICGDDILRRARHAIGLTLAADEYAGRFYAHDASPGTVLTLPQGGNINDEQTQKAKTAWKRWHQGLTRAHEPAILPFGTVLSRLDPDHQKMQLHESRKFQVVETARIWRMPLHKLAELDRSTNNNIEWQGKDYVQQTLAPHFCRWIDAVHRCLLTSEEQYWGSGRPRMFAKFDTDKLESADSASLTAQYITLLQNGVYSINEVRMKLGSSPIGPDGDEHRQQMQMIDISAPPPTDNAAPQPKQPLVN